MVDHRRRSRDDGGETLIELIVALSILGIAAVAILAGVMTSIRASTLHRNEASGGTYVRSFAEAIQNHVDTSGGYASCGSAATVYEGVVVPSLPSGYTKKVTDVQSWTGSVWGACTTTGIQRVRLTITTTGGDAKADENLTVVLRQPCNGNATAASDNPCA